MSRVINWLKKHILGYEVFYGVDYGVKDGDYSCWVYGERHKDGTVVINSVEYLKQTTQSKGSKQ